MAIGEIGGIALKSKIASIFTVVAIFVMAMFAGMQFSRFDIFFDFQLMKAAIF